MFNHSKIRHLYNEAERNNKNFKKKDFLKEIGMTAPSYDAIEQGNSVPKVSTLWSIAKYFGKDMNYFFDLEEKIIQKESKVEFINPDSLLLKRVEELAIENSKLKEENEALKRGEPARRYTMPDVQNFSAAEPEVELKTPHSQTN